MEDPAMTEEQLHLMRRRTDDLNARMERQEESTRAIEAGVSRGNASLELLKSEVHHQSSMTDMRLKDFGEFNRQTAAKLDAILRDIALMGSDPQNTSAGRAVILRIDNERKAVEESIKALAEALKGLADTVAATNSAVSEIRSWQSNVAGVIGMAKWMGFGNIVLVIYLLLKNLGALP